MEVKDATLTIERSGSVTLSTVELFEIKTLLLQMRQLRKLTMEHEIGDYQSAHCCCAAETSADSAGGEAADACLRRARKEKQRSIRCRRNISLQIPRRCSTNSTRVGIA